MKKDFYAKILAVIFFGSMFFWLLAVGAYKCFGFGIINEDGVVLTLIGILATFVVVSNYAQVKEIENSFNEKVAEIKNEFSDRIKELNNIIISKEKDYNNKVAGLYFNIYHIFLDKMPEQSFFYLMQSLKYQDISIITENDIKRIDLVIKNIEANDKIKRIHNDKTKMFPISKNYKLFWIEKIIKIQEKYPNNETINSIIIFIDRYVDEHSNNK
ncbi:MAG: hypothetical protein LBN27_11780 [Prevotellaceae bacterium]|jgi:hypothetical protein|nr:hypothetical protein [Prevotellaceae bacterium]